MNIKRRKFELISQADGTHRLFVLDGKLAQRINRILKSWPLRALGADSEAVFTIPENSRAKVFKILGISKA